MIGVCAIRVYHIVFVCKIEGETIVFIVVHSNVLVKNFTLDFHCKSPSLMMVITAVLIKPLFITRNIHKDYHRCDHNLTAHIKWSLCSYSLLMDNVR